MYICIYVYIYIPRDADACDAGVGGPKRATAGASGSSGAPPMAGLLDEAVTQVRADTAYQEQDAYMYIYI